jgi:O-antigen/teichoic acid export membrane protein
MTEPVDNAKDLKKKAVRGVFWALAENGGGQATQFITFLVLARLLQPEAFGLISLANIFIHFIQSLVDSGFSDAIVQRKQLEKGHLNTAFWANLVIGALLAGIGVLSAPLIAGFFKQPTIAPIIAWLSLNVVINSVAGTQQALLRRNLNFKGLAKRKVFGMVAGSITGITMAFAGYGVWSLVGQTLVGNLLGVILLWQISDWRPEFSASFKYFKDLASFGSNVMGIGLLVFFSRRIDDFLIGYYLGPTALGYYTIAYKLFLTIMQLLQEGTQKVSLPTFSKMQDNPLGLQRAFYSATALTCFASFPAFLGMAAVAPELVSVVFGEQWIPSIPIMQILALNGVLVSAMSFTGPMIMAMGKPSWNLGLLFVNTVVKTVAFLLVVQQGIVFVAIALVIANYFVLPTRLWVTKRLLQVSWLKFAKQLMAPTLGSIMMVVAILAAKAALQNTVDLRVLLTGNMILGTLIYLLSIWILAPSLFQKLRNIVAGALP